MSKKKLTKEEIEDIEYLQKRFFESLKIPFKYLGTKEEDTIGVKSLDIKKDKDE
jgi:hypothetical protein